jgi:hypothetical protein
MNPYSLVYFLKEINKRSNHRTETRAFVTERWITNECAVACLMDKKGHHQ